ncbi:EF-hand domain-containing protein [Rhizobiaceae bacterium n13]|uniref:EF-hand domain-containing protein n=2 Tax=Ferirhizobium litorale TaxID=2927786 RepID=A0AAE3QGF6_9HYPH|nr:EF-hand domain-containing protein [Fererhizobium litorale]MDI7865132.1 EF-hand domain-containing protein [Fererhizobium litorale]MDI7922896.1 EF-hand domain-containing protein [Fererhizobium litorale]
MTSAKLASVAIAATLFSISTTTPMYGQTPSGQNQEQQPDWSEMMPGPMMGWRHQGGGSRGPAMRGHMMKIMFAVADVDGDGALSFDEVVTIHKRIFDKADANKDGKVTIEEMQAFMRD